MERVCFTIGLVPGQEVEYERRHQEIWPEMVRAIADAGIRNFTGFLRDHEVIYYAECYPDRDTAWAKLEATEVNGRWVSSFDGIALTVYDPSGRLFFLRQVAHLD